MSNIHRQRHNPPRWGSIKRTAGRLIWAALNVLVALAISLAAIVSPTSSGGTPAPPPEYAHSYQLPQQHLPHWPDQTPFVAYLLKDDTEPHEGADCSPDTDGPADRQGRE
jgi:hypothetical protein